MAKWSRSGMKAEIWVLPHDGYSCGGFYIAERFPAGLNLKIGDNYYNDDLCFWLLSGPMGVLSKHQAEHCMDYRRSLGEAITMVWADALPEGSRWLNLRRAQ